MSDKPLSQSCTEGVQSRLEACHTEAVQQLRKCKKCGKIILAMHSTTLAFLLIPALTCSYLPCIYSGQVILVGLYRGFTPSGYGPV